MSARSLIIQSLRASSINCQPSNAINPGHNYLNINDGKIASAATKPRPKVRPGERWISRALKERQIKGPRDDRRRIAGRNDSIACRYINCIANECHTEPIVSISTELSDVGVRLYWLNEIIYGSYVANTLWDQHRKLFAMQIHRHWWHRRDKIERSSSFTPRRKNRLYQMLISN